MVFMRADPAEPFSQSIGPGESLIELSRGEDGPVRFDVGVIDRNEPHLSFRIDPGGGERSRPPFRHSIRLAPGPSQQPVYLPLRKGTNRIIASGAAVQSIEARPPDVRPCRPPNQLIIPITSYCNFQCVMCPHGLPGGVKGRAHYPDQVADLLIAELNQYDQSCDVALTGLGESFMAPVFGRFVDAVTNPLVRFNFTTNGSMLTRQSDRMDTVLKNMASERVTRCWHSGDILRNPALRPDAIVVRNLEALAEARSGIGSDGLLARAQHDAERVRENLDDIEPFLRLASWLKAGAYLAYLNDYDSNENWRVEHNGFVFDYQRQILRRDPELTGKISGARSLAKALGVPFNMEISTCDRCSTSAPPANESTLIPPQSRHEHSSDLALSRSLGYRRRSRRRRPRGRQCCNVLFAGTHRQHSNRRRAHGSLARPGGAVGERARMPRGRDFHYQCANAS